MRIDASGCGSSTTPISVRSRFQSVSSRFSKNGGTASFSTASGEVYIAVAYDEKGGFMGQAPPPSGSPVMVYGMNGTDSATAGHAWSQGQSHRHVRRQSAHAVVDRVRLGAQGAARCSRVRKVRAGCGWVRTGHGGSVFDSDCLSLARSTEKCARISSERLRSGTRRAGAFFVGGGADLRESKSNPEEMLCARVATSSRRAECEVRPAPDRRPCRTWPHPVAPGRTWPHLAAPSRTR